MKIAIGCDEAAFDLKEIIRNMIAGMGHEVEDFGTYDQSESVLYPDVAIRSAESVRDGNNERAILICGTGIGMSISANKVNNVYAAVCHDVYSTRRSILSNNCNVMCMGARVIGAETAKAMVEEWLKLEFADGPSTEKVDRIRQYEQAIL